MNQCIIIIIIIIMAREHKAVLLLCRAIYCMVRSGVWPQQASIDHRRSHHHNKQRLYKIRT